MENINNKNKVKNLNTLINEDSEDSHTNIIKYINNNDIYP
jgi:hypothetical protein